MWVRLPPGPPSLLVFQVVVCLAPWRHKCGRAGKDVAGAGDGPALAARGLRVLDLDPFSYTPFY